MGNDLNQEIHHILIAVDASDNSRRAVSYVGRMLGGKNGFKVTLLHVIPDPEEDYFRDEGEKQVWLNEYRRKSDEVLNDYRNMLIQAGFSEGAVDMNMPLRYCPSMAECILLERDSRRYGTIVVGRQGLSRKEEFLFGSISSKIVNHARNCTVWVVA